MARLGCAWNRGLLTAIVAAVTAGPLMASERPAASDLGIYQRFDTDRNGAVTQAEFDADRRKQLALFDANRDGLVSVDEIDVLIADRLAKRGKADGRGRSQAAIVKADVNRDGFISFDEFAASGRAAFAAGDTNRDGTLSSVEAQALGAAPVRERQ